MWFASILDKKNDTYKTLVCGVWCVGNAFKLLLVVTLRSVIHNSLNYHHNKKSVIPLWPRKTERLNNNERKKEKNPLFII